MKHQSPSIKSQISSNDRNSNFSFGSFKIGIWSLLQFGICDLGFHQVTLVPPVSEWQGRNGLGRSMKEWNETKSEGCRKKIGDDPGDEDHRHQLLKEAGTKPFTQNGAIWQKSMKRKTYSWKWVSRWPLALREFRSSSSLLIWRYRVSDKQSSFPSACLQAF